MIYEVSFSLWKKIFGFSSLKFYRLNPKLRYRFSGLEDPHEFCSKKILAIFFIILIDFSVGLWILENHFFIFFSKKNEKKKRKKWKKIFSFSIFFLWNNFYRANIVFYWPTFKYDVKKKNEIFVSIFFKKIQNYLWKRWKLQQIWVFQTHEV